MGKGKGSKILLGLGIAAGVLGLGGLVLWASAAPVLLPVVPPSPAPRPAPPPAPQGPPVEPPPAPVPPGPQDGEGPVIEDKGAGAIEVTDDDNGAVLVLHLGQDLVLRLRDRTDGGYGPWLFTEADAPDPKVIAVRSSYKEEPSGQQGDTGFDTFSISSEGLGETALVLRSTRSWETADQALDFRLTVRVVEALRSPQQVYTTSEDYQGPPGSFPPPKVEASS